MSGNAAYIDTGRTAARAAHHKTVVHITGFKIERGERALRFGGE